MIPFLKMSFDTRTSRDFLPVVQQKQVGGNGQWDHGVSSSSSLDLG